MKYIALFASGSGTNAERIMARLQGHTNARVSIVLTDNPASGVIARAEKFGVPVYVVRRRNLDAESTLETLRAHRVSFIVLSGFLGLVPTRLIQAFPKRIINIHPALLPSFGGKGMYGERVHKAVIAAGVPESGITIHYVNENYDEGETILQAKCPVLPEDTPASLALRVHELEYAHFPDTVERIAVALPEGIEGLNCESKR